MNQYNQPDWIYFSTNILIALWLICQALVNIYKKRVTKFGLDAVMIFIVTTFFAPKYKEMITSFSKEPKRVQRVGINALFVAAGFVYYAIKWYVENSP